jgi:hypothetical protein
MTEAAFYSAHSRSHPLCVPPAWRTCSCYLPTHAVVLCGPHHDTACLPACLPVVISFPQAASSSPSLALSHGLSDSARRQLAWWLGGCSAWVFSMVVLGGFTRLTRSGLSMTDWKFTGARCMCRVVLCWGVMRTCSSGSASPTAAGGHTCLCS